MGEWKWKLLLKGYDSYNHSDDHDFKIQTQITKLFRFCNKSQMPVANNWVQK